MKTHQRTNLDLNGSLALWLGRQAMAVVLGIGMLAPLSVVAQEARELRLVRNELATEQDIAALVLEEIYRRAGLANRSTPLPASRANALALSGEVDGEVARVQAYADKTPTLLQVRPAYYYLDSVAFARKGIKVTDRNSLAPYRVGIVRGIEYARVVVAMAKRVEAVSTYEQMFQMLEAGHIDVAIDSGVNGKRVLHKLGLKDIQVAGILVRLDLFHLLHPRQASVADKISKQIKLLKENGELDKLVSKAEDQVIRSSGKGGQP